MKTLPIRGAEHHYDRTHPETDRSAQNAEVGSSREPLTVIFIHGWLLGRSYWQPVMERLKAELPCVSYDLRGFGESHLSGHPVNGHQEMSDPSLPDSEGEVSNVPETYNLEAYAQDLEEMLDQLGIGPVWLVGHSLGGSIALWAAHRMGQRVAGVTCVNAGGGIYLKEEFEKFRSAGQQILKFRPRWLLQFPGLDRIFARTAVCQNIGLSFGRQRLRDFIDADSVAARFSLLTSTTEEEVHRLPQLLSELPQPVYFIAGQQDRIMEPRYVRHLASFHPLFQQQGENVVELENCGHLAMVEHPDAVALHIRKAIGVNVHE
jgi:2-succinyl-6-hydroxy-2,4-cyclohexadiene-1-carboxylate synthase